MDILGEKEWTVEDCSELEKLDVCKDGCAFYRNREIQQRVGFFGGWGEAKTLFVCFEHVTLEMPVGQPIEMSNRQLVMQD